MGLIHLLQPALLLGVDEMDYIELKDKSVKFRLEKDRLYLRLGIWDYTDIYIDREAFIEHNSNFDNFVVLFLDLLNGKRKKKNDFSDPYWIALLDELIENHLIIGYEERQQSLLYVITDESNYDKLVKYNCLCNRNAQIHLLNETFEVDENFNYFVVLNNPKVHTLKNLNKQFFKAKKSWNMGIIDGKFMHLTSFVPNITGCFECFELNNSIRMADYENYINYLEIEEKMNLTKNVWSSSLFMYQFLLMLADKKVSSLRGKLLSVYLPTLEFNLETLHKSSLCSLDGLRAQKISQNLNLNAQTVIKKILEDKNDK